jgi:hypothetical protein
MADRRHEEIESSEYYMPARTKYQRTAISQLSTDQIKSNHNETMDDFEKMTLEELVQGIHEHISERSSAVEQRAIMPTIKGKPRNDGGVRNAHQNFS